MGAANPALGPAGALRPVGARRRRTDRAMRGLMLAGTLLALIPLALILYYLLHKGLSSWSGNFFTTDPVGGGLFAHANVGGIKSALIGTVEMVALASVIAIPVGLGVALWLTEYGRDSVLASTIRYFIDVLTGVPSIVFGLFIYVVLVVSGGGFAGYKGSLALALLMLPVVTRAAEVVLLLVPNSLREAALALGAPRWRVTFSVVLRTAISGIVTGVLLAVARAAGETAPLLFTAFGSQATTTDLGKPMNSLPFEIYTDIQNPSNAINNRAWGAALTLVVLILLLNLFARVASRRSRLA